VSPFCRQCLLVRPPIRASSNSRPPISARHRSHTSAITLEQAPRGPSASDSDSYDVVAMARTDSGKSAPFHPAHLAALRALYQSRRAVSFSPTRARLRLTNRPIPALADCLAQQILRCAPVSLSTARLPTGVLSVSVRCAPSHPIFDRLFKWALPYIQTLILGDDDPFDGFLHACGLRNPIVISLRHETLSFSPALCSAAAASTI